MTSVISTQSSLARPSAVTSRTMTDLERVAFGQGSITLCLDPREVAPEYSRLTLRDRIGARACQFNGGSIGEMNGNPAIDLAGVSSVSGRVDFTLPQSGYFLAAAVNLRAPIADTEAILAHTDSSGNRLFFGMMVDGLLRLDHGTANAVTATGAVSADAPHVIWGTYDPIAGVAHIGVDAVTELTQGAMPVAPKQNQQFHAYGGLGVQAVNGLCGPLIVGNQYLGGAQHHAQREALLGWLAQYGGVSLSA